MKSFFSKLFLLITLLVVSGTNSFAQYEWTKYASNPLNIHGSPGSWNQSVLAPCVIYNSELNRYEMWFTAFSSYPSAGIGFAYSIDGINWTLHPTPVMTPSVTGWDSLFVGAVSVLKVGGTYKMWYTGWKSTTRFPHSIGYATSPDGINWTKHSGPVLTPLTGWESGAVGYPSVIKVGNSYLMFYTGEITFGVARTGRAISSDGINWQRYVNNPVLPAGGSGTWDQNNYLGRVIELNNTLYLYYTGESNPGVSGSAIGFATSVDTGKTWNKYSGNPVLIRGTTGQWDNGWIEMGSVLFAQNELKLYYDGGGSATGNQGRVGLAFSDPLPAGTYTVGVGGYFPTIDSAFNKLSGDGIAGNITLELIDELYVAPSGQFGFTLNGPIPGTGPNSRVTIKPAENKNVVIEGNNEGLLYLINTSYVTFDGVAISGSTTLTIHAIQNSAYVFNDALDFINDSDHDVIQNIIFIVDDNTRASGAGFWYNQTGSFAPDSNLIQNNFVKKAGTALYIVGSTSAIKGKGNIIRGNQIGSETDSLIAFGIQVTRCENTIIENNTVQNLKVTINGTDQIQAGILSSISSGDIIRNNIFGNFRAGNGYSSSGIFLGGDASNIGVDILIYNNLIYDIQSISAQNDSRVTGIQTWYQNNPKIYYNSVYLSGTGSQKLGSAAFYIGGGNTGIDAENNIFVNTRDEGQYCASAIFGYTSSSLNSDYNDLYYDDTKPNNCLVRIGTANYNTLAEWQALGKDPNSITEMPHFVAPRDLHIDGNFETFLDNGATPIQGIETDIDGEPRNWLHPDIGADEFTIVGVEDEETLPIEFALEQNYPNPFNPSTILSYQLPIAGDVTLKVFDILGNEVAMLVNEYRSPGKYEVEFNASSLPSGVYFYQLRAGEYVDTKKMILLK